MNLSIWIFAEWLSLYHPRLEVHDGNLDIVSARFFSKEMPIDKHTLYVGYMSEFFEGNRSNIICVHNNDIILLDTEEREEVLNCVLDALTFYNEWHTALMRTIYRPDSALADFFSCSKNQLPQPMFVLDDTQSALALSEDYGVGAIDSFWDDMLLYGHSQVEQVIPFNEKYASLYEKKEIYKVENEFFPNKGYAKNIFVQGQWMGIFEILELEAPLSKATQDLFQILGGFIEQWMGIHMEQQEYLLTDNYFQELLGGNQSHFTDFQRKMQLNGWKEEDVKIVLRLTGNSESYNFDTHFAKLLAAQFPSAYISVYEMSIVMLCNLEKKSLEEVKKELLPWLKKNSYYAGMSYTFRKLEWLSGQYQQTKIPQKYAKSEVGEMYACNDYALEYGAHVMQQHITTDITNPMLYKLRDYDAKKHTDYFRTLYEYLRHERNQVATAAALNLHRNSFLHRLKKLEDLLEVDLDDPMVRLHLLFSYEFLLSETSS